MADRLRGLWDFSDLDGSEARLRAQLEREPDDAGRAEVLTQRARVEGLRGRFDEAEALVAEAETQAGSSPIVRARVDLERGRILRSSGDAATAFPLFERAFQTALEAGQDFVAVDAAHMAAIATDDGDVVEAWTRRGIELAETSSEPGVDYWLGPLLNNLGWHQVEAGELGSALATFRRALEARERDSGKPQQAEVARYCVAKVLRLLDRADEALPLLERAVAWTEAAGQPDGYFHEELAECYAALGREDDAREHAALARSLLDANA
jgi:tetratricopeptide (TPR) repeat protein